MNKNFEAGFNRRCEELEKTALAGPLIRAGWSALKGVGGAIARNPMKSLGIGLTAMEIGGGATQGARAAARGANTRTFNVSPVTGTM